MRSKFCSQILNIFLVPIFLCSLVQVEGKIRRRRQDVSNNSGRYASDPVIASFYENGGTYTGNDQENNRLIVGGAVYQYPTAVNVMNAGSYNPQQYNSYPDSGRDYYSNMNDMRLSSSNQWNTRYQVQRYPSILISNSNQPYANISLIIILFFNCLICNSIL